MHGAFDFAYNKDTLKSVKPQSEGARTGPYSHAAGRL